MGHLQCFPVQLTFIDIPKKSLSVYLMRCTAEMRHFVLLFMKQCRKSGANSPGTACYENVFSHFTFCLFMQSNIKVWKRFMVTCNPCQACQIIKGINELHHGSTGQETAERGVVMFNASFANFIVNLR